MQNTLTKKRDKQKKCNGKKNMFVEGHVFIVTSWLDEKQDSIWEADYSLNIR